VPRAAGRNSAENVAPRWKQAVGATIHCIAGDATGIIAGALTARGLHLPIAFDRAL